MDGLEATRRIRALPGAARQVPILALTAYTFPDQVAQCREAGMDGHIAKPVDYKTLVDGVDEVITRIATDKTRGDPTAQAAASAVPPPAPEQRRPAEADAIVT